MNKLMKVLAASALIATTLVGCGGTSTKYAKAGLGVVTSMGHTDPTEVNTTVAGIGLDKDGKIQWAYIDVAQGVPGSDTQKTKTKKELKEEYDMKKLSGIQKEWYEQIAAFEAQLIGKTPEEVSKIAVDAEGKPTDADIKAGCTMAITDFQKAVAAAATNAKEVATDSLSLGMVMSYENDTYKPADPMIYLTTDIALVAKDGDGKILLADIETAKIKNDGSNLKTKTELKEAYNMKTTSGIQKEWYEQVAALEAQLVGKTAADVSKIAVGEDGKPTDADIKAGCTIEINMFIKAIENAMK